MSFQNLALENIFKRHPDARRHGLQETLRTITDGEFGRHGVGFIPDACEFKDGTLTIYEVEDTNKLTEVKLANIQLLGHELLDCTGIQTRLICTDRYGRLETQVWHVLDDLTAVAEEGRQ